MPFQVPQPMGRKRLFGASQVLAALQAHILKTGQPPTIDELRRALRVGSTRTVFRYLQGLETDGLIERWPGARGLRPLRGRAAKGAATVAIPIVGEAPAGSPFLAEQNIEGWIRVPRAFLRSPKTRSFLLRVRGDSMNRARLGDDRIEDGDLVLVRQEQDASDGDVVVALVDGEVTIKRLRRGSGYAILMPESSNTTHQPIVAEESLVVQGTVERVFKRGATLLSRTMD